MLAGGRPTSALDGVLTFVRQFGGGLAAGYLARWVITLLMPILRASRLAEATLTIGFAYVVFIVCDHYLGFSGVVAVASAALAVSAGGRCRLSPSNRESLVVTWEQLAFWASSLFAAMQTPDLLAQASRGDLAPHGALIVAALLVRALTLCGLIPMLSFAGSETDRCELQARHVVGRDAASQFLSHSHSPRPRTRRCRPRFQFVEILAAGFVLFPLPATAPTMRSLMRLLKISNAPPAEVALRQRVIGLSLSSIPQEIETVERQHQVSPEIAAEVARTYDALTRDPAEIAVENARLPGELRERAALSVLADREQEFCLDYFEGRTVSRRVAASLLVRAARLRDGARSDGVDGYQKAAARILGFNPTFRLSLAIHRRVGIARPLARQLADRFEVQLAARFVLQNVIAFNRDRIEQLFGTGPSGAMAQQLERRFRAIDRAISALKLQYPTYAVRPDGACHQWREVPPRELSIDLVADERLGRVTGRVEAS